MLQPNYSALSCYAAKFDNHNLLELCGAGILPARIIQTKCTTAYLFFVGWVKQQRNPPLREFGVRSFSFGDATRTEL